MLLVEQDVNLSRFKRNLGYDRRTIIKMLYTYNKYIQGRIFMCGLCPRVYQTLRLSQFLRLHLQIHIFSVGNGQFLILPYLDAIMSCVFCSSHLEAIPSSLGGQSCVPVLEKK